MALGDADRLSTFSSRSATLLSMRKISPSSCEKDLAMVLRSLLPRLASIAPWLGRCIYLQCRRGGKDVVRAKKGWGQTHDCGRRPFGFQSRSSSSSVMLGLFWG